MYTYSPSLYIPGRSTEDRRRTHNVLYLATQHGISLPHPRRKAITLSSSEPARTTQRAERHAHRLRHLHPGIHRARHGPAKRRSGQLFDNLFRLAPA